MYQLQTEVTANICETNDKGDIQDSVVADTNGKGFDWIFS
jgi:hypothetical protein